MPSSMAPILLSLLSLSAGCAGDVLTDPEMGAALLRTGGAAVVRPTGGRCSIEGQLISRPALNPRCSR
ncbi:MAG: hypothetical protein SGI84_03350 [Gemmatimonadota bacterium]|nr:hypothetical protein [Gemmatimonadota bacterium]